MTIPVTGGAAATAAALLDAATLIEESGAAGLTVTCYTDRVSILVGTSAGNARHRAGIVAALGELAGAARCRQADVAGERPAAWLDAAGQAGGTVVEITTPLAVRAVPGGTLAAGPGGQQAVIAAGQQPPPGWRWVTELDDGPGSEAA
ncbi:MAG: hypothetical protein J2P26_08895 [Nocardiopsaceae bacterium]|nr:hypothetical protein [Nocardiopsaceae bacterium]